MADALQTRLLRRLVACCGPHLAGQRLCVGFSGGLDSSVLLHALAALRPEHGFTLSALHVHHGLSPDAESWVAHCETVCRSWALPLAIHRVRVRHDDGKGLEAAARAARHAVFSACDADWVVLAQHRDDQAETVLHNLLRGSGVAGAAGMRECDPARRLLRPLLGEARACLREYAESHALIWVEDGSNADSRFTRNHLRNEILPALGGRFPAAAANLARAAEHFRGAEQLLSELADEDWRRVQADPTEARAALRRLDDTRLGNLLRGVLRKAGELAPSTARLDDAIRQLRGASPLYLPFERQVLCAWRGTVWLEPRVASIAPLPCPWHGEASLPWGETWIEFRRQHGAGALRLPSEGGVGLASRRDGMVLRVRAGGPARSLRKLCQELGIPTWMRDRLPVLWWGDEPVWVGGVGAAVSYLCNHDELGWHVTWHRR